MNKLVIGCGYIGARVAQRWIAAGNSVVATSRRPDRSLELHEGLTRIKADVLQPDSLKTLPATSTVLYAVGFDRTANATMRDVYVQGLRNVLQNLPAPRQFIYISSTGVYGQTNGEEINETAATDPREESGRIALDAERVLREKCPEAVILRFAGIYGPGRILRRKAIQEGEPLIGDPEKWLNLIHAEDAVAAILAAEDRAAPGRVYNVADDCPVLRREFYTFLANLLHASSPRFQPPEPGQPPPPHESNNRRILNRRLREELRVQLRYPSFAEGLTAALRDDES